MKKVSILMTRLGDSSHSITATILSLTILFTPMLSSCGDNGGGSPSDPTEETEEPEDPNTPILPDTPPAHGKRLASVRESHRFRSSNNNGVSWSSWSAGTPYTYTFVYNSDSKVTKIVRGYETLSISYNPFSVKYTGDEGLELKASTNLNGFLKNWSMSEMGDIFFTASFSYNTDGYLTKASVIEESESSKADFNWNKGLLTDTSFEEEESYNGFDYTYNFTSKIIYGNQENTAEHFPAGYTYFMPDLCEFGIFMVGLYGKAPSKLPISATETQNGYSFSTVNGNTTATKVTTTSNYSFSYIMNSDGTFNTEKVTTQQSDNGSSYIYEYEYTYTYTYEDR